MLNTMQLKKQFFYVILLLVMALSSELEAQQFLKQQLAQSRVKEAKADTDMELKRLFEEKGLSYPSNQLFFRVFKKESLFEMWAKNTKTNQYVLIKTYNICSMSGTAGPKRREGDYQVPEGFYYVDYYNPWSNFHLSVRINYPNQSDRILSPHKKSLGGDICIHGACVSIGCVAIEDENIKEVYWLMVQAHGAGQAKIPVHIFPSQLDDVSFKTLKEQFKNEKEMIALWENLKNGYAYFEEKKQLPIITVDTKGKYIFQ